jgi:hypothetical protein
MKCIIAGGRYFKPTRDSVPFLDILVRVYPITEVVSGCASGADSLGERWANARNIPVAQFPAEWARYGNAAGPLRNEQMAKHAVGGLCVLFPGGRGTANMRWNASAYKLITIEVDP